LLTGIFLFTFKGSGVAVAESSTEIDLIPLSYDEWNSKLSSLKPDIVVVDFWATWCAPCLKRFPHLVQLHEEYSGKGVRVVSMCLDDRDDPGSVEAARDFLVAQGAKFDNFLMNENMLDAFEKLDLLGIPAVFIYDRTGKMRYRLTGDNPNNQFSDKDVETSISELLSE
jgi:thiol-disulfide isomerase/thioredoxin